MPITYYPTFKNSSGNVGIGNINPSYRLDIKAATTNGSTVFVIRNANDANNLAFYDNGTASAGSDFRAPIFYDSNDTAYYLDPANTTLSLKTRSSIVINNASAPNNNAMLNIGYSGGGETRAIDIQGGWSSGENKSITFTHASGTANIVAQINAQHNGPGSKLRWGKLYHSGDSSTYTMELISESTTSAYLYVAGSVRTPIFYDNDNTAYYIDAASTSNLNVLVVAASARVGGAASRSTSGLTVGFTDNSTFAANSDVGDTDRMLSIVNESSTTNAMSVLGFRVNPNGGTANAMLDVKFVQTGATNTSGLHYTFNHGGTFADRFSILSSGNVGVGAIAPDTNLQVVGHVHVGNQTTFENTGGWNKTIYLDGTYHARLRILGSAYASGKNSQTETYLWVDNTVSPYSGLVTNAGSFTINAGFTTLTNSARSPIFYDSDNTTYYVDAASTSVLNIINSVSLNGNYIGVSNTTNTNGYGISLYNGAVAGEPTYGIMFQGTATFGTHGSVTGDWATYFTMNNDNTRGWIFRKTGGGGNTASISAGGIITASSDVRAPIFYDSGDTTYYVDPAGTSRVNTLYVANVLADSASGNGRILLYGNLHIDAYGANDIYCNYYSGRRFKTYKGAATGAETFRADTDGIIYAFEQFRTPIVYDYNNTAYYIDAASTSVINRIDLPSGSAAINTTTPGTAAYQLNFTGQSTVDNAQAITWGWSTSGAQAGIYVQSSGGYGTKMYIATTDSFATGSKTALTIDHNGVVTTNRNYLQATGSLRAPILYDSDNTAFYCDPTATSNFTGLTVANTITGSVSGNAGTAAILQTARNINGTSFNGSAAITTATWGTARTITIGSTGKSVDGSGNVSWSLAELGAVALAGSTMTGVLTTYTPAVQTLVTGLSAFNAGVNIGERSVGSAAGFVPGYGQTTVYTGGYRSHMILGSYRTASAWGGGPFIAWGGNDNYATEYWLFNQGGAITHSGGKTMAYTDGTNASGSWGISVTGSSASCTGNSATTTLATKATRANGDFFIDDNYGNTVVGLYSATRLQGVFAMGNSYKLTADGTGVGTLYGLAWSHPNFGGVAANLADHGLLILQNGVFKGAWGGGSLRTPGDVRGTLFYDWDNTAYYCDPASTSNLNAITAAGNITAVNYYTSGWFRNNVSGNGLYNESTTQHFYSDNVSYWNVASSSGAQGIRFRTGGHNGTIRGHVYANDSNDVGLLNNGGNWRLRIVGGDYALFDGSSIRAPIFYDSNDTNYYCDPNGTSSLAAVNANAYYPHGGVTESDIYARSLSINAYHHGDSLTYDTFQFNAASVYETRATVGASFVSGTVETSIFRGDRFGGMTIANNVYQVRWTWNNTIGYKFFKTLYIANSTNGNSFTVTIESSANGSTWTTIATTGAMSNWPGHSWYNYFWNNNATQGYIRITVTPTWVNANSMDIYSMRYFCSYSLDAGARLYDWDYNRNVTFPAFVDATQFRDTNNTAYYIDAASTSNLVGLTVANTITGSITGNAGGSSASCTGNAATATILQTARNINGTSFNGSAAITTATWGTARTITIGSTGKSVDGSGNVSWSLAELGAAATNQTMFIGTTSFAINRASASQTLTGISIDGSSTSCSGNAATATTTDNINGRAFSNRDSGNGVGQDAYTNNGVGYVTGVSLFSQTDGGIHASAYSASWVHQIYGDFRTGQIAIRGRNNGTWQAWRAVLDDTNYTTYTVTKTGTGASGSWGISVTGSSASCTGNAATVTNGMYLSGDQNISGAKYFTSNKGATSTVGANNTYSLEAFSSDAGAAGMSFHRGGYYAVNMGLDPDNVLRIGGWSASANRWELDMSGNNWVASSFRAPIFYDSNDTNYYTDPASTSRLNLLRTRNTFGERATVTSSSSTTVDTQYNVTELTMSASITTLTLSNIQASAIVHMWTIVTVGNGTTYSITWPAAIKWPGGTAPTITATNTKRDIYQFVTYDGGTTIYAIIVGQNL